MLSPHMGVHQQLALNTTASKVKLSGTKVECESDIRMHVLVTLSFIFSLTDISC